MSSFSGGDSADITQENPLSFRTSASTSKKKMIINIRPLDVSKELKKLEEDSSDGEESVTVEKRSVRKLELIEIPEEAGEQPQLNTNKENDGGDSFYKGFAALSLITPAKQAKAPAKSLATLKSSNQVKQSLETKFVTPMRNPPRIQCTVDMKSGLNTPINKLSRPPTNTFRKIKVNGTEYVVLSQLGRGGSSEVVHCFDPKKETQCALKCVSLTNPTSAEGFIKEVEMLQKLQNCDRIIRMYDYEINNAKQLLLVALELGGKDLGKILKELPPHLPLYLLIYYWMEMLLAVQQLHSRGIIHADLKPANFLHADNHLKLIDFGISCAIETDMTSIIKPVAEGSYHYISPEALNNVGSSPSQKSGKYKISFKSDVWSLGCILYQLVYRRAPFQHIPNAYMKFTAICDPSCEIPYPEAAKVPKLILNTIKSCLNRNVKSRPSVDDLIQDYEHFLR